MKGFLPVLLAILLMGVLIFGGCGGQEPAQPATPAAPAIPTYNYDEAQNHVGETAIVCGPIADVGEVSDAPVTPKPYVVIVGEKGATFGGSQYLPDNFSFNIAEVLDQVPGGDPIAYFSVGKTVCVSGEIIKTPVETIAIEITNFTEQIEVK